MQEMAQSRGILFIETSAKDDINVKQLFEVIVREIDKEPLKPTEPVLKIQPVSQNHGSTCYIWFHDRLKLHYE